jgi:regulator of sigma E protease
MMGSVFAFVAALAILIAVHEYGHYKMARLCGIRVLKFSIGFGRSLWTWQSKKTGVEFSIGVVPLGGYVRMLDEREAPVPVEQRHEAFNTQPLSRRVLVVLAGPVANLLLAVLLFAAVSFGGYQEPRALLASPPANSLAAAAGLQGREAVVRAALGDEATIRVDSFEHLRWLLAKAAMRGQDIRLETRDEYGRAGVLVLPVSRLSLKEITPELYAEIGITFPWTAAVMGQIQPGGAALRAGLREGDRVLAIDDVLVRDGAHLRQLIRAGVKDGKAFPQFWQVQRGEGGAFGVTVQPEPHQVGVEWVGRVGAYVGTAPEMVLVRRGVADSLAHGVEKTWEMSSVTIHMLGRMLMGEASLKNLSGPLSIADHAGKSAAMGVVPFVLFLAVISVSLGVLNLLPIPLLDGGHLMYYLWEYVTGRPVSEYWLDIFQRVGLGIVAMMMFVALFNDVVRLFG